MYSSGTASNPGCSGFETPGATPSDSDSDSDSAAQSTVANAAHPVDASDEQQVPPRRDRVHVLHRARALAEPEVDRERRVVERGILLGVHEHADDAAAAAAAAAVVVVELSRDEQVAVEEVPAVEFVRGVALGEEEQAREEPPRVAAPHAPRPVRARARRELAPRARGAVAVWEGHDARVQGVAKRRRGRGGAREGEQGSRDGALGERDALEARLEASSGSEHRAHEFRRERATREVVPSERVGGRLIGRGARRRAPRAARTTRANRVEAGAAAP